jgi:hypothetical protein
MHLMIMGRVLDWAQRPINAVISMGRRNIQLTPKSLKTKAKSAG